jgi:hypothetical protein
VISLLLLVLVLACVTLTQLFIIDTPNMNHLKFSLHQLRCRIPYLSCIAGNVREGKFGDESGGPGPTSSTLEH